MPTYKIENRKDAKRLRPGCFVRRFNKNSSQSYIVKKITDDTIYFVNSEGKDVHFSWKYLFMFHEVFLVVPSAEVRRTDSQGNDRSGDKYIIWSPTAPMPPRVILEMDLNGASKIASEMAERHGGTFYACKLSAISERKEVVTHKIVSTKL